jgi:uncharacterized membrane protein
LKAPDLPQRIVLVVLQNEKASPKRKDHSHIPENLSITHEVEFSVSSDSSKRKRIQKGTGHSTVGAIHEKAVSEPHVSGSYRNALRDKSALNWNPLIWKVGVPERKRRLWSTTMTDSSEPMCGNSPTCLEDNPEGCSSLRFPVLAKDDITTIAHYYRGEMARMMSWRDRLDRTTNWAIGAVAAMLSITLATASAHHGVLIFSMVLVFLLLQIESRRYRFFHLFRTRVRLLERNYYGPFFDPENQSTDLEWAAELAETLRNPRFTISRRQAMARRLARNYCWIFLILLCAWLLKTTTAVLQPRTGEAEFIHSGEEFLHNTAIGYIPGEIVLAGVLIFYGWLFYVMIRHRTQQGELTFGEAHV